jgi:hypothetical protein
MEMDMVPDSMTLDSMKELLPESEMDTVPDSITLDPRVSVEAPSPLVLAAEDVVDSLLPADVVALDSQKPDEGITPAEGPSVPGDRCTPVIHCSICFVIRASAV